MKSNLLLCAFLCFLWWPLHSQQNWTEALRYASPANELLDNTSLAMGADGSIYVLGNFKNQAVFGNLSLNAPVPNRTFGYLLKLGPAMNPLWVKAFPQKPYDLNVDVQGNVFIAGSLRRALDDNADSLAYVAKYDANGGLLAQFTAGGSAETWAKVVRTDASGNCFVTGERFSAGTAIFGVTVMPSVSSRECFLLKLSPNLSQVLWAQYTGASPNLDNVYDLVVDDANGFVYTSGNYSQNYSPPIFGCGCYNGDFFVEKHNAMNGNSVWKKVFSGGSGDDTKQFVQLSPDGQTLSVAACFKKTTLLEPALSLTANPNNQYDYHIYLAAVNTSSAIVQWAKKISTSGDSYLWRMARQADEVWLHGYFAKPMILGNYSLSNINNDAFLAKTSAVDGAVTEAEKIAGNLIDRGFGLAVQDTQVVVSGISSSTILNIGNFSLPGNNFSTYVARKGGMLQVPPTANFTVDTTAGCAPFTTQFNATGAPNPASFLWLFPGGTPASSTEENPSVTYTAPGTYSVTLVVQNAAGADTLLQSGLIQVLEANPTVVFNTSLNNFEATFSNSSSNASAYHWDFGDGQTSTETNPVHAYAACGVYTVTLIAEGPCGTASSTSSLNIGNGLPTAFFMSNVDGLSASFVNNSSNASAYFWDFGDGQTSTETNPVHVYELCGVYTVTLSAEGQCGTVVSSSSLSIGNGLPTASFESNVDGLSVAFVNNSSNASTYLWDFGDGQTSTETNPVHVYADCDNYVVILLSTNACGAISNTMLVSATEPPSAQFSIVVDSLQVSVTNTSTVGASYFWDFGDGTTSTLLMPPPHTYADFGTYIITLVVTNQCGANILQQTATLVPCPTAAFEVSTNGLAASFHNLSLQGTAYLWDFGDGQSSTEENPVHFYSSNGVYTVTLTVSNDCGQETTVMMVTVNTVGTELPAWVDAYQLFPNPTKGVFTLEMTQHAGGRMKFECYNAAGQPFIRETIFLDRPSLSQQFSLQDAPDGIYWIRATAEGSSWVRKLVLQR